MQDDVLKNNFELVFRENRWGNPESVSGAGSALSSPSVIESVRSLDEIIRSLAVRSICDAPCGDFHWFSLILGRFPHLEYVGVDIVADLISWNKQRYPTRDFRVLDICLSSPPKVDLIFCKDVFLHIPNGHIARALRNFKLSGSRYLMATSVVGATNGELVDPEPGEFRHIDLLQPPFSLPAPMWSTAYLALWALDAIPMSFFDKLCADLA